MSKTYKKIAYVTGTRADFGLMRSTLELIHQDAELELFVIATGMHLSHRFGNTISEIKDAGLSVCAEIAVDVERETGAAMANNIAIITQSCVEVLQRIKADIIILLGDRGEMLAGAIAAIHLNIPILHIHGGERSGTVDEPVRHAISKLSHIHCVTTQDAKTRLEKMGEREENIFIVGAPGIDGIEKHVTKSRTALIEEFEFSDEKPVALMVFHPTLQDAQIAGEQMSDLIEACLSEAIQLICLMPNSDAGGGAIRDVLEKFKTTNLVRLKTHLERPDFLNCMAHCDFMIGNSSSGIIEAASFNKLAINVGNRQNLRFQSGNIINVEVDKIAIRDAIREALLGKDEKFVNLYGDGNAGQRIVSILKQASLTKDLLKKINSY